MAVVDISQYQFMARDSNGQVIPTGQEPSSVLQVNITAGSVQSSAFGNGTRYVRVHADAACRIAFGENPTAAATSMRMAANSTEFFGVTPGHKIAVITST